MSIRWARARLLESLYALPLALEAASLICFGIKGRTFVGGRVLSTVMLLCFTMGRQNAIVTKISDAVIRTTHMTGMVTDIGIALGRLVSANFPAQYALATELDNIRLLRSLIGALFIGGVTGALGFNHIGFFFTLPLAAILLVLAVVPVLDDLVNPKKWMI